MRRITKHPLFPVPKVYVPFMAGVITLAAEIVRTGIVDRVRLAELVVVGGYAVIGYATPSGRNRDQ